MKETYWDHSTIQEISMKLLQDLEGIRRSDHIPFQPDMSALLILDMQRYFLDNISHALVPSAEMIIENIARLAEQYVRKGLQVIVTRHVNDANNAGLLSKRWNDLIEKDNPLSNVISEFHSDDYLVLEKHQYDAFYQTKLEKLLKNRGITQLVITGVMTHLCVESTVRSAFVRGFMVFLPVDGTATYNWMFHQASLLNLSHGFVNPVLSKDLLNVMENGI
jgi:isochorismate hydrolase